MLTDPVKVELFEDIEYVERIFNYFLCLSFILVFLVSNLPCEKFLLVQFAYAK